MKKITLSKIAIILCAAIMALYLGVNREYKIYIILTGLILIVPIIIIKLLNDRKTDQVKGSKEFRTSILNMIIVAMALAVGYFII